MPEVTINEPSAEPVNVEVPVAEAAEPTPAVEDDTEVTPETELFEGGPTKAQIDEWKSQFKKVYVTEVADEQYIVWRTLRRAEYRKLVSDLENQVASNQYSQAEANMNNEEAMAQLCMLWPAETSVQSIAAGLAGMPSIIAQQIMEASGFMSLQIREL